MPLGGIDQPVEQPQHRRLAAARWPEERGGAVAKVGADPLEDGLAVAGQVYVAELEGHGPDNPRVAETEPIPFGISPMLAKDGKVPVGERLGVRDQVGRRRGRSAYAEKGKWRMFEPSGGKDHYSLPQLASIAKQLGKRSAVIWMARSWPSTSAACPASSDPAPHDPHPLPGRSRCAARDTPVTLVIFYLLHLDGKSTRDLAYTERRELLHGLELDGDCWQTPANHAGPGEDLLDAMRKRNLEGIVAKRRDSPYRPAGRTGEWIKTRIWKRQEFVIGGYIPGEGSRSGRAGSLLVGYWDKRAGRCERNRSPASDLRGRRGFRDEGGRHRLPHQGAEKRLRKDSPFDVGAPRGPKARLAVFCEPELVCEVSWTEWTHEGTLRQPAFKGMRPGQGPPRCRA